MASHRGEKIKKHWNKWRLEDKIFGVMFIGLLLVYILSLTMFNAFTAILFFGYAFIVVLASAALMVYTTIRDKAKEAAFEEEQRLKRGELNEIRDEANRIYRDWEDGNNGPK